MNLVSLLIERAGRHPDRPALIDAAGRRDRVVTFGELARRVEAGAAQLQQAGLRRGRTVLVFQPVSIELYEFLLAAFHSGLRVMLADPSAGSAFLNLCCQRVAPDAFFGSWKAQWLRTAVRSLRRIPIAWCSAWFPGARRWKTPAGAMPLTDVPADEAALITFTSGSTGVPKAAVRTHGFLLAQHRALSEALDYKEGEVDLVTLPVFVLANLASGLTSVLASPGFARSGRLDAGEIHRQCRAHEVTRCAASPAFFEALLRSPAGMPGFRKVSTGGAPVFPDLLSRLREALPQARIESVYGSTEAEPIAHFPADQLDAETRATTLHGGGLCVGLPVETIGLKILSDRWGNPVGPLTEQTFSSLQVVSGQVGEIVVSGEHVLPGYLGGVGDDETKISVGGKIWHRTGDAGWLDRRGRVWLLGRCAQKLAPFVAADASVPDDAMRYPFAIECALRERFPGIRVAAIDWKGRRVLAVEAKSNLANRDAIVGVASGFGIERVMAIDSLPMDRRHHAKIDYPALRKKLESL